MKIKFPMLFFRKREAERSYDRVPLWSKIMLLATGLSLVLYLCFRLFPAFADSMNRTVSHWLRMLLAMLTAWIPFSLAEGLVLFIPVLLVLLVLHAIRTRCDSWRAVGTYFVEIISGLCAFVILFVWMFAAGYSCATVDAPEKLNLSRQDVTTEQLQDLTERLVDHLNEEAELVDFLYQDFSVMPYSVEKMNEKLLTAYDSFCEKYDFMTNYRSRVKPVMLSPLWSYTHITGVYTYFTGEANINVHFPDYTVPYTAAHELAHQRGIAREDEANLIAFLVCIGSDDPYIRYSGYLNLYEFASSALYSADQELYLEARNRLSLPVRYELYAYSQFYDQYRDSVAGAITGSVNEGYIKFQGSRSYGLVVDLAVAYYQSQP